MHGGSTVLVLPNGGSIAPTITTHGRSSPRTMDPPFQSSPTAAQPLLRSPCTAAPPHTWRLHRSTPPKQRDWFMKRTLQLHEESVEIRTKAFELEKRRFKWLRFCSKKDRVLERIRLENEMSALENERIDDAGEVGGDGIGDEEV